MDARALFYQDSHLCRFTALVTGCHPMPDGWAVSLDRTAFYPEGGGQPWDLGTLGAVSYTHLDVYKRQSMLISPTNGVVPRNMSMVHR